MSERRCARVLVAEDDLFVSEAIRGQLEKSGYTVVGSAARGCEAVEMASSLRPDVVVMDIKMPDISGIEATSRIQERCPTPVVVLTAHETPELVREAGEAGAGAYLVKPPDAAALERAIQIAVARFSDMMELRRLNDDLEARDRDLETFTHTITHDLQNWLSLIVGYAEALRKYRTTLSEQELETCVQTIEQTGRSVSTTLDQLVLLTRAGGRDPEPVPLDMGTIVARARNRLAWIIEFAGAEMTLPQTWPTVLGHSAWIEEVWVNCLGNAIKHARKPPRLELGATAREGGAVRFWVRDCVPVELPERDPPLASWAQPERCQTDGHGLQIAIAERIVRMLGGQVETEGEACLFAFSLPAPDDQWPAG
jgi:AmiR/NasT family two-component response regulator